MAYEWSVYIQESNGNWTADTSIRRPNDNLEIPWSSTMSKVALADGSFGFITLDTKYSKDPINFIWVNDDGTLKTQLQTYLINGDTLKIVTHTGEQFIGKIVKISRVWLTGVSPDIYDFSVTFEQTE